MPECRVSGLGFRVSGFGFRVSGFGFRVSGSGFRVPGSGFRVSGFEFRVPGFGCQVPDFGKAHAQCGAGKSLLMLPTGEQSGAPRRALQGPLHLIWRPNRMYYALTEHLLFN